MAIIRNSIGKVLGHMGNTRDKVLTNSVVERHTMGWLNKGWRALLFANRAGLTPKILGGSPDSRNYDSSSSVTVSDMASESIQENSHFQEVKGRRILIGRDLKDVKHNVSNAFTHGTNKVSENLMRQGNQVMIINPCVVDKDGNPDIIILQNRPPELEHQPKSAWAAVKSMGRNTPFYHYTGGEIELHINTSWYLPGKPGDNIPAKWGGGKFNPYWVLNQCRKLEAWTMANGYVQAPPVLMIRWGSSDLYKDFLWILKSATYKLKDFHDRTLDIDLEYDKEGYTRQVGKTKYIDQGLIPYSATQELIFQRISGINLWYNDIMLLREINPKANGAQNALALNSMAIMAKTESQGSNSNIGNIINSPIAPTGIIGETHNLV